MVYFLSLLVCSFSCITLASLTAAQHDDHDADRTFHRVTHTRNLSARKVKRDDTLANPEVIEIPLPTTTRSRITTDISNPTKNILRGKARQFVHNALTYIETSGLDQAFAHFTESEQFAHRGLNLFVIDLEGQCFYHRDEPELTWTNLSERRDAFGSYIIRSVIKKAQQGGGWVIYEWNGGIKHAFIKQFEKDGVTYILSCDYYSHSQETLVVALVQGAVDLVRNSIDQNRDIKEAFSIISYPLSRFSVGDLYVFAYDFNGINVADNIRSSAIGTDEIDLKNDTGIPIIKRFIEVLRPIDNDAGVWVEYQYRQSTIRVYLRKVQDNKGNFYLLGCGYYPEINRKTVIDLVNKGYELIKLLGANESSLSFSSKTNNEYIQGPLYLTLYDRKGICIADGNNPDIVGHDRWNDQDQDGNYYVRTFIKEAETHPNGIWINARFRNSLYSYFVRYVDLGIEEFILVCGYTPLSATEEMILLTKSARSFMQNHDLYHTFNEFNRKKSNFIRGNLSVIVVGGTGICYAFGQEPNLTWQNIYSLHKNRQVLFETNITPFERGYKIFNLRFQQHYYTIYMEKIKKDKKDFFIGAALYV